MIICLQFNLSAFSDNTPLMHAPCLAFAPAWLFALCVIIFGRHDALFGIFFPSLGANILGFCDWFPAVLGLFGSPYLCLFVC